MPYRYRLIAVLWIFQVANYFDRTVISFTGPAMMKSLSIGPGEFGIILSSFAIGYALSQVPGGMLADRWGAKCVLVAAPALWAVFTGLTGLVSTVAALMVVRGCLGLSEGMSNSASTKVIGDFFSSKERAFAGGIWATALAVGPALAGPIVGLLLASYDWQAIFLILVVPTALATALNAIVLPGRADERQLAIGRADAPEDGAAGSFATFIRQPSFWLVSLIWFMHMIAYWAYLGWMPSYLALQRHIDLKSSGMLSAIPYVAGVAGLLVIGWLGSGPLLRQRPRLLAGSYALAALALYAAFNAESLAVNKRGIGTPLAG